MVQQAGALHTDSWSSAAQDGAGGVFVAGSSDALAWLARYDGAGTLLWSTTFGTAQDDTVHAAAADGAGGVYVAGTTANGPSWGLWSEAWMARFDGAGQRLASDRIGAALDDDEAVGSDLGPPRWRVRRGSDERCSGWPPGRRLRRLAGALRRPVPVGAVSTRRSSAGRRGHTRRRQLGRGEHHPLLRSAREVTHTARRAPRRTGAPPREATLHLDSVAP